MIKKYKAIAVHLIVFVMLPVLLLTLPGCSAEQAKTTRTLFIMDTHVDITFYSSSVQVAQTAIGEIFTEMQRLESLLSRHIAGSDLQRINEAAGREPVQVSPETLFVLRRALEIAALSDGAFDPTIAPLLELWGFGGESFAVPSADQLAQARELVNYRVVEIDEEQGSVFLPRSGMKLDLGGIAKGYIVDKGQELARGSVSASFINAGGDISIRGRKPSGDAWRVAVQDPHDPQRWVAVINMDEGSVVTSGDYQRFFEVEGRRYHHILDPHTGMPAFGLSSVTIVAPDTTTADALATAVFVLGEEKGMALVESLPNVDALIVDNNGKLLISSGLEGQVEVLQGQ
ncbi:MAG: FAD:protein FMN transferase [Bacillota bacterium]